MRMFLLVLDSVGIGAAPDAGDYGDAGACTLGHLAAAVGGLQLPCMQRMGLGNAAALLGPSAHIPGVDPATSPSGSWGVMRARSAGKDTTTGHWELAGLELKKGFATFPSEGPAFPRPLLDEFSRATGRGIIGNRAASGTAIIEELGDEHMLTGRWIIYTSADSVFQIAAHEDVIPLPELYGGCGKARELCNPLRVGRVIARPFTGRPGAFQRTQNRRDFSYPLPEPTVLDHISEAGIRVTTIGKLDDIFAGRGISDSMHAESNAGAQKAMTARAADPEAGFVFANFIDFDMLYGHRRDAAGYAQCLRETDTYLAGFVELLRPDDVLVICADHGNDPTFKGTDHTREYVPLLVYPRQQNGCLGIRNGFYDVAQSAASVFGLPPMPRGTPFLDIRRS